jgi:hypothetical protein
MKNVHEPRSHSQRARDEGRAAAAQRAHKAPARGPCWDFTKGYCRRAHECRFSHSGGGAAAVAVVAVAAAVVEVAVVVVAAAGAVGAAVVAAAAMAAETAPGERGSAPAAPRGSTDGRDDGERSGG